MKKSIAAKLLSGLTAVTMALSNIPSLVAFAEQNTNSAQNEDGSYNITESNRNALLGVDNPDDYYLGIASQFSVFLQGDFTAIGSDCEGRLAAGGSANLNPDNMAYSAGSRVEKDTAKAHVIIGGDTLKNFDPGQRNFVVPEGATVSDDIYGQVNTGNCKLYRGQLIDFDEEFKKLIQKSQDISKLESNATLTKSQWFVKGWTISGNDPQLNVLTIDPASSPEFFGEYLDITVMIPEGSHLIVNVPGTNVVNDK